MTVFVIAGQIVDAGYHHRVDDDDLTEKHDFTAWDTFAKPRPGLLAVCIARLHPED